MIAHKTKHHSFLPEICRVLSWKEIFLGKVTYDAQEIVSSGFIGCNRPVVISVRKHVPWLWKRHARMGRNNTGNVLEPVNYQLARLKSRLTSYIADDLAAILAHAINAIMSFND